MGADNELTEKLRFLSGVLRTEGAINASDDVLRAAAEIGRLRGEVEELKARRAEDVSILDDIRDAIGGGPYDTIAKRIRQAIAPAEAKDPAPAMPNGVEAEDRVLDEVWPLWRNNPDGVHVTEYRKFIRAALRLRAADNRDAAGVDPLRMRLIDLLFTEAAAQTETGITGLADKILAMIDTPAAVPAGEAVAQTLRDALAYVGYRTDGDLSTLAERAELWMRESRVLIDSQSELIAWMKADATTPQPADGEAVAPLGYVRRKAISAMREDDDVTGIMVHIEAPSDSVPVYLHPPAPVQAAPQEGVSIGGLRNVDPKVAAARMREHADRLRTRQNTLGRIAGGKADHSDGAAADLLETGARALDAAHPSACELGAVRELVKVWRIAVNSASTTNKQDLRPERFIRELEAALQHRGDSRGGEG